MQIQEIVRVTEVAGIFFESKDSREEVRFRIEVLRLGPPKQRNYAARVLRWDMFRAAPSFPQSDGSPISEAADSEFLVIDDTFGNEQMRGRTIQEALGAALEAIRRRFEPTKR